LQNEYELKVKNIFRKSKLLSDSLIIIDKLNQSILNSFFSQQLKSYESEIDKLLKDDYEQELLINKLRSEEREFETLEEYDTAKSLLFLLLENPKSLAVQNYMTIKKTGKVEIRIKNETSPA
jgi:hypothetical protein